ncbi:MAG: L-aspartate oxidase [Actinobacteria bacterium]|nr:L-aspartate oxidase [Actinomycetota bacterium]
MKNSYLYSDRFLANPNNFIDVGESSPLIIIGSGIAGLWVSYKVSRRFLVTIVTKGEVSDSTTWHAQGGIAAAIQKPDDPEKHFKDTLSVGQGLCDERAVRMLVEMAPQIISELQDVGVNFDKKDGTINLTTEGGHSYPRVVHAKGDSTGAEIENSLVALTRSVGGINILQEHLAVDIVLDADGAVHGVTVLDEVSGELKYLRAKSILIATGGIGQLYEFNTNPAVSTGDGIAIAYRAGAEISDMEFEQFHPTVFITKKGEPFLITEALRGEGAYLLDPDGRRFMKGIHPLNELAPRDIVVKKMVGVMCEKACDKLYLDARHIPESKLLERFPMIVSMLKENGIDIHDDLIPISPAMHYMIGGIKTDVSGATSVMGLFSCGEAADTWVHGANRLASNSLLEGMVFGNIVSESIMKYISASSGAAKKSDLSGAISHESSAGDSADISEFKSMMSKYAGIIRSKVGLDGLLDYIMGSGLERKSGISRRALEARNMALLGRLIAYGAILREESRGVHLREDFPDVDDLKWKRHISFKEGRVELSKFV